MNIRTLLGAVFAAAIQISITGCNASAADSTPGASKEAPVAVENTFPRDGHSGISQNTAISVTFNEEMITSTVNNRTFTLMENGVTPVLGSITPAGTSATFKPLQPLKPFTVYTATVTTGMVCQDEEASLQNNYSWTFATGADLDDTPPQVADHAFGVQVQDGVHEPVVVAFFSEPLDPASVNAGTVLLADAHGSAVPLKVQYIGVSALMYPTAPLAPDAVYTATVTTGVTDLAGNHMQQPHSWTVSTPNLATLTGKSAPSVTSTSPGHDVADVLLGTGIMITFSQAMDPASIDPTSIVLSGPGGTPVADSVTYTGFTATLSPAHLLAPNTTYVVSVTTATRSLDGIPLAAAYEWTFTTGEDVAGTPPVVDFTVPFAQDADVALNASIIADFDEPMDPASLNPVTFTLTDQIGGAVVGTVTYTGTTAVFTPGSELLPGMTYTARITTAATDLNGEPMSSDYVWSFTTGSGSGASIPQVIFTDPGVSAGDVSPYKKINIAFSEVMDPATLTTGTITVTDSQGNPVTGTVTYLAFAAVFVPTQPLEQGETYTVTVSGQVKDIEGTTLGSDYTWSFFTAVML